jgi:pilus assembly protein CpaC
MNANKCPRRVAVSRILPGNKNTNVEEDLAMRRKARPLFSAWLVMGCILGVLLVVVGPIVAQGPFRASNGKAETITVNVGQSQVVKAPWPVKRVSISDPNIADVKVLTADQVLVMGRNVGTTDLLMWSEREDLWQARVEVGSDVGYIRAELARLFPRSSITVAQSRDMIVVSGQHARAEDVAQLRKFLDATNVKYVDVTTAAGVQQVQIQVRIAEVSRTAIRALGVNGFMGGNDAFGGMTIGPASGGALNPVSIGVAEGASATHGVPFTFTNADVGVSSSMTLFGGFPHADLEIFLQALAENQYLRILAEPTLVALSGQEASFLAGGEVPYPVTQGGGAAGAVTIEWKEYGVRLRFRPTVQGDGKIGLTVAPEVSELDDSRAVTTTSGRIPAVVTRKAQTTLELKSGQSFGMAGLISRSISGRNSRVPGLGDLPVLGALFRSARYTAGETELVVLVTASLVEPMSVTTSPPLPGEADTIPNDWEFYALGRLEGPSQAVTSPAIVAWLKSSGLDRLRGPGAWARYDAPPAGATTQPALETTEPPSGQP